MVAFFCGFGIGAMCGVFSFALVAVGKGGDKSE